MKTSLDGIRRKVDQLEAGVLAACSKPHRFYKTTDVWGDQPVPEWPDRRAPPVCSCGQTIDYVHNVDHFTSQVAP